MGGSLVGYGNVKEVERGKVCRESGSTVLVYSKADCESC